jgi:hypothetical protein
VNATYSSSVIRSMARDRAQQYILQRLAGLRENLPDTKRGA